MAGIVAGFAVWFYTLLLPSFADAGWIARGFLDDGPLGAGLLALFALRRLLLHGHIAWCALWLLPVALASLALAKAWPQ